MSGPKCHQVRVSAEVRRQRERQRLDDARAQRCRQLATELMRLAKQLPSGTGVAAVPEPGSRSHESLLAWESDLRQAIDQAKGMVSAKAAQDIMRRLNSANEDLDVSGVGLGGRPSHAPNAGVASKDEALARVSENLARVATSISGLHDPALRAELADLAARIGRIDSPEQAKGDLLTLKSKVSYAVRIQECREQAAEVISELADIESDNADRLRQQALNASTPADVSNLRRDVEALVQAMTSDAEAAFILDTLEEVLEELGFEIGEGFELSDFGAVTVAEHPDHPGFGLRFQVGSNNEQLFTRVVALEASTAERASQAEEETCTKVFAVADGLRRAGIEARLTSERLPGEAPVQAVAASDQVQPKTTRRRGRTRRTNGAKERER